MNNIIRFPVRRPTTQIAAFVGVIAGSTVIDGANGPLLEVRFVTALDTLEPDQRKQLPNMLASGNFTFITLEQEP